MIFDLLFLRDNKNTINLDVFDDIRLRQLFEKFFDEQHVESIINILCHPLSEDGIKYRQEVFREIDDPDIVNYLTNLHKSLLNVNRCFKTYNNSENYPYNKIHYLYLIDTYIAFVEIAIDQVIYEKTKSYLLKGLIEHFKNIASLSEFNRIKKQTSELIATLNEINNISIRVRSSQENSPQFSIMIENHKTIIDDLKEAVYHFGFAWKEKNWQQKEATVFFVNALRKLYPQVFLDLDEYDRTNNGWFDSDVLGYIGQIEFYLDMRLFIDELKKSGIGLCYPTISKSRQIQISSAKDITLLVNLKDNIIPNDIDFTDIDRIFLLTGANGGGKTTYLRALGICLILFLSGLPIPAATADIYPFICLFTHFPADESITKSRMVNEKAKAGIILDNAGKDSVVLLNETFSSTNETVAVNESIDLIVKLNERKTFTLFVTHQHGLSDYQDALQQCNVGYLEAVVLHNDENTRTFKIVRKQPDQKSYAKDILEKYGLTRERLKQRLMNRKVTQ